MRFFALGILSSLTLVLPACGDDKDVTTGATATNTTTAGPTTDEPTTDTPGSTGTTASQTTGTGTTTDTPTTDTPTTDEPGTTTTATTTTTDTTGPVDTTGEPGSTGVGMTTADTTGGGMFPQGGDYEQCSNEKMIMCEDGFCIDSASTNDQVKGAFCSPECSGPGNICPKPMGLDPSVQALCAFDTDADMMPDICALICQLANDKCPEGSTCEDIGIPEMQGMKFGVCSYPAP